VPDTPALYARVQEMAPGSCDLLVTPDRFVARMVFANLLHPIDAQAIANLANLDAAFRNAAFDPGRRFSVACLWGMVGVGFRRSAVTDPTEGWGPLLDSDRHAGRIGWLEDPQLMLSIALRHLGHSVNTLANADIEAATRLLERQRPRVAALAADGAALLSARSVDLAVARNGDLARAAEHDPDLAWIAPGEGLLLVQDCFCIPRGATRAEDAHRLIDFFLRADAGAELARSTHYATPNAAARATLPEELRADAVIYPSSDVLGRAEIPAYRGERMLQIYERAWQRVNAHA
jgi:spermidine/putrescine transport system substrate-binding protein